MTKNDILKAAFKIWASDFFINPSLSTLAKGLGVTKPALYRHFKNKEAILNAMRIDFYDKFAAFFESHYRLALTKKDSCGILVSLSRSISEFNILNEDYFLYSIAHINKIYEERGGKRDFFCELKKRGVDLSKLDHIFTNENPYPKKIYLVMCHSTFESAKHNINRISGNQLCDIQTFLNNVETSIKYGLGFDIKKIAKINFEQIEKDSRIFIQPAEDSGHILNAAADVIFNVGLHEVTMEKVAEKAGLHKSSLYSHFINKNDMIKKVFINEIEQMIQFLMANKQTSGTNEERLYYTFFSIVHYLRVKPCALSILDHLRMHWMDVSGKGKACDGAARRPGPPTASRDDKPPRRRAGRRHDPLAFGRPAPQIDDRRAGMSTPHCRASPPSNGWSERAVRGRPRRSRSLAAPPPRRQPLEV
ncbi:MAG: TetR family transcriptional regulator, partial [Spirochaetaceae bacterium]|nr:TetR family transcriptional regulator [Spirochaetaceae bacterium]